VDTPVVEKREQKVADVVGAPGAKDMESAKLLYVKLKAKWDSGVDGCPTNIGDLRAGLGDGKMTEPWGGMDGLRHKYFAYCEETDTVSGVYVFFSQAKLDAYMATELFASHKQMPHFSSVDAEVVDVMSGTELSIEKTAWSHTPPTREDVSKAVMLIVQIKMDFNSGVEGCPTKEEELRGFMMAPPTGMGYPAQFGALEGLRGKYFGYNSETETCYGFYTFLDKASLDKYMASDLFKKQGEPPHIKELTFTIHEVLPGTERSLDQGSWTGQ